MSDERPDTLQVVTVDQAELIVRVIEAATGTKRPVADPRQTLDQTDKSMIQQAWRAAQAANGYLVECLRAGGAPITQEFLRGNQEIH